jgi:hypothetical protein
MDAAMIFSTGRPGGDGARKYVYKLICRPFKVIFTDRPRIFRKKRII